MAENKILPWAQTGTANVLSDADYASDVASGGLYGDGVKTGQASSKQANKTWRQATAPGSGLGQFLVDNLSVDVTDADTPSTFSSRIANAVLKLAQISPFNQSWATATGGYRKYAMVSDSSGNFWVSTADQNTTVPGADGATWQSLFNGYATQAWANGQFLQLALATLQTVTGPVAFRGKTTVPSVTAFTGTDALNALTADARYVRSVPATGGTNVRIVDVQEDASENLIATKSDGTTASYAPSSYGTFTDGYWIQTGNIRQIWWSQKIHSNDTVPFPLAFASAPEVFPVQTEYQDQLPQFAMGFACINDAKTTATSCVILSLVIQDSGGSFFPAPSGGVVVKFYAVGPVS